MCGFEALAGYVAVYPRKTDACYVDGGQVQAQAGDVYGAWITTAKHQSLLGTLIS
jgi:hypothetical protein